MVTGGLLLVNIVFNPNGMVPNTVGVARAGWRKVSHRMEALSRRLTGWVTDGWGRGGFAGAGQLIGAVSDSDRDDAARTGRDEIPDRSDILLEIRDLTVVFGAAEAVAGVSLNCRGGEVIGIIGPNGSGKTTRTAIRATSPPRCLPGPEYLPAGPPARRSDRRARRCRSRGTGPAGPAGCARRGQRRDAQP